MDPPADAFVPIAQLDPSLDLASTSVRGVVTLVWPYSASRRTFSVLLVESDFRLRQNKGQVRITFKRSCAKALARTGIASGDEVNLRLAGSRFFQADPTIQTPGKGIEWELGFDRNVWLEIRRKNTDVKTIEIDKGSYSPEPLRPFTPPPPRTPVDHASPISLMSFMTTSSWSTPAFLKRKKRDFSNSLASSSQYDMFAEDELAASERAPKRVRFSGSKQWRVAERSPSPTRDDSQTGNVKRPEPDTPDLSATSATGTDNRLSGSSGPPISQTTKTAKDVPLFPKASPDKTSEVADLPESTVDARPEASSFTSSILSSGQETPSFPPDEHPASQLTFGSGFTDFSVPYSTKQSAQPSSTSQRRMVSPSRDSNLKREIVSVEELSEGSTQEDRKVEANSNTIRSTVPNSQMVTRPDTDIPASSPHTAERNNAKPGEHVNTMDQPPADDKEQTQRRSSDISVNPLSQVAGGQALPDIHQWLPSPTNFQNQPQDPAFELVSSPTNAETPGLSHSFFNFDSYTDSQELAPEVPLDATFIGLPGIDAIPSAPPQQLGDAMAESSAGEAVNVPVLAQHPLTGISVVRDFQIFPRSSQAEPRRPHATPIVSEESNTVERATLLGGKAVPISESNPLESSRRNNQIPLKSPRMPSSEVPSTQSKDLGSVTSGGLGISAPSQQPEVIELSSGDESSDTDTEPKADVRHALSRNTEQKEYAKQDVLSNTGKRPHPDLEEFNPPKDSTVAPQNKEADASNVESDSRTYQTIQNLTLSQDGGYSDTTKSMTSDGMSEYPIAMEADEPQMQTADGLEQEVIQPPVSSLSHSWGDENIEISPSQEVQITQPMANVPPRSNDRSLDFVEPKTNAQPAKTQSVPQDTDGHVSSGASSPAKDNSASNVTTGIENKVLEQVSTVSKPSEVVSGPLNEDDKSSTNDHNEPGPHIRSPVSRKQVSKPDNIPEKVQALSGLPTRTTRARNKPPPLPPQKSPTEPSTDSFQEPSVVSKSRQSARSRKRTGAEEPLKAQEHDGSPRVQAKQSKRQSIVDRLKAFRKPGGEKQGFSPQAATKKSEASEAHIITPDTGRTQKTYKERKSRPESSRSAQSKKSSDKHPTTATAEKEPAHTTRSRRSQRSQFKDKDHSSLGAPLQNDPASAQLLAESAANPEPLTLLPVKKGVRTSYAYYTPLSNLHQHVQTQVDTLSVIVGTSAPQRAPLGPRDWHMTLYVTDLSLSDADGSTPICTVQILRPSRNALPRSAEAGDILLAHSLKCVTRTRRPMLTSDRSSGWAIFSATGTRAPGKKLRAKKKLDGPPLDYGDTELNLIERMHAWWDRVHESTKEDLEQRATAAREAAKEAARRRSGRKSVAQPGEIIHELRNGSQYPYTDTLLVSSDEGGDNAMA